MESRTYSYRPPQLVPSGRQRQSTADPSNSSLELSPFTPLLSSITVATDSSLYDGIINPTDIDIPFTDLDEESCAFSENLVDIQSIQTSLPLHTVISAVNDVGLSDEITDRLEDLGAADISDRERVIKSVQMDKANDPMTMQATHSILEDIERQKSRISKTAPISLSKSMKSRVNLHFDGVDKMKLSRSRTNTNSHQKWQISLNREFSKLISPFIESKNSLQEQCLDVDPQCTDRIRESGDIRSCPCIARMCVVLQIYKKYEQEIIKEMNGDTVDRMFQTKMYDNTAMEEDFQHIHSVHMGSIFNAKHICSELRSSVKIKCENAQCELKGRLQCKADDMRAFERRI